MIVLLMGVTIWARAASAEAGPAAGAEVAASEATRTNDVEEIVVTGRRPGPPLWRALNGDNTLWILGTLDRLPKSLEWDSDAVEHILGTSHAFIEPPSVVAGTSNPIKAMRFFSKIRQLERLPGDATLDGLLDAALYARFDAARGRYAPRNTKLDRLRPLFAGERLLEEAFDAVGLSSEDKTLGTLRKLAKRARLPIHSSSVEVDVDRALEVLAHYEPDGEIACLRATLETIDGDLQSSIDRAMAWADGDASALLRMDYPDVTFECRATLRSSPAAREAVAESRLSWLRHARNVLASHPSSVTVLPMREIVAPDGLLAELKAAGFRIHGQAPDSDQPATTPPAEPVSPPVTAHP